LWDKTAVGFSSFGKEIQAMKETSCSRRPLRPESRIPLVVFMCVVMLSLAWVSLTIDTDPYAKARAIQSWPIVDVSTKNLIDECGVFMWVRWSGPDIEGDGPYIPMKYIYD